MQLPMERHGHRGMIEVEESAELLDEIWVASEFVRNSISPEVDKPVHVVPIPLIPPSVPALGPWIAQQTDRKRFLLTLDATPGAPAPSLIPRDIGLIYKEKPQPAGLTNQGR